MLTSVHLPRRHRIAALARRQQRQPGRRRGRCRPSWHVRTRTNGGTAGLPPDDALIDIGDINTALDAAASLIFHHCELLTPQATPASDIVNNFISEPDGIDALATSILNQSKLHEQDPSNPNWAISQPGQGPAARSTPPTRVYTWSAATMGTCACR